MAKIDQLFNKQLLEAAMHKMKHVTDKERTKKKKNWGRDSMYLKHQPYK